MCTSKICVYVEYAKNLRITLVFAPFYHHINTCILVVRNIGNDIMQLYWNTCTINLLLLMFSLFQSYRVFCWWHNWLPYEINYKFSDMMYFLYFPYFFNGSFISSIDWSLCAMHWRRPKVSEWWLLLWWADLLQNQQNGHWWHLW